MKVWITKYALTIGIEEIEVEQNERIPSLVTERREDWPRSFHGEGRDWHRTPEAAVERAEKMRKAKLASIDKQRKRVADLKFHV